MENIKRLSSSLLPSECLAPRLSSEGLATLLVNLRDTAVINDCSFGNTVINRYHAIALCKALGLDPSASPSGTALGAYNQHCKEVIAARRGFTAEDAEYTPSHTLRGAAMQHDREVIAAGRGFTAEDAEFTPSHTMRGAAMQHDQEVVH